MSSSTQIKDLPDEIELITNESMIRDILVVFILLFISGNNEVIKGILRFPLVKMQKSDISFNILISIIFTLLFGIYKVLKI